MGTPKTPKVPDPAKTYAQGIETNIKYAPQVAAAEDKLRGDYDGKYVQQSLDRQGQFGGRAVDLYQGYLKDIDPQGQAIRSALGADVARDLKAGTSLGSDLAREYDQGIRAAQSARGNTLGNSAVSAEALNRGSAAQQMYQQRLTNAGSFLQQDTAIRDLTSTAGLLSAATTPDRTDAYVNPQAGIQGQNTALQFYQTALQGGAAGGGNPWVSALANVGGQAAGAGIQVGASALKNYFNQTGAFASAAGGG